jgi:basic amino acid/polyamine antiporter, APA family
MTMSEKLGKKIGLWTLTCIGVGGIIGSGIFAMPAVMGAVAGPALVLGIFIAGIISLFLALAYAELGATYPLEGGTYALPRLAMGNLAGFVTGWGYFIYLFTGTAAIINIFVVYMGYYIPGLVEKETLTPLGIGVAVAVLWIFTLINVYRVEWGGLYSIVTTIGKLIPMILFGLVGLAFFRGDNFTPFMPFGFEGVTLAVTLFFWSYTGFEALVVPAGEVKNPSRTIPLAMILTMLVTIFIYLFIAVVFVGMLDWQGVHLAAKSWKDLVSLSTPLANAAHGISLPWLAVIATVGAIIATGGSGGTWVLIQGRMPYAMAEDNLFWSPIGKVHPKYKTPAISLIFTSFLSTLVLVLIPHFPSITLIASVALVLPCAAAVLALALLRKTDPATPRPFKIPAVKIFSIVGFVLATYLIYWASWPWTMVGIVLLLTGYPAFLLVKVKEKEVGRTLWIPVYLLGILFFSFIGDPKYVFSNFTPWVPQGILKMPWDFMAIALFALMIFLWAYKANVKSKPKI